MIHSSDRNRSPDRQDTGAVPPPDRSIASPSPLTRVSLAQIKTFDALNNLLDSTLPPRNAAAQKERIAQIRRGERSVLTLDLSSGLQDKVHQMLWAPASAQDSGNYHARQNYRDDPYVPAETPWIRTVYQGHPGYSGFERTFTSDFVALESALLEASKAPGRPNTFNHTLRDTQGILWELEYGLDKGSGGRQGVGRMRPADDESRKKLADPQWRAARVGRLRAAADAQEKARLEQSPPQEQRGFLGKIRSLFS